MTAPNPTPALRRLALTLAGFIIMVALLVALLSWYNESYAPAAAPAPMSELPTEVSLATLNTTRLGSDDPIETAVAVAQAIYPVTEEENAPGAVVLIPDNDLAVAMLAASRVQHFPVNAPLLYVSEAGLPALSRAELLRLKPEGVPMDRNVQVYLVGTQAAAVEAEVQALGFRTRAFPTDDPFLLAEILDDWSSTQHGDHKNPVAVVHIDHLALGIPVAFWNAHRGDGLVFVTDEGLPPATRRVLERRAHGPWLYLFGDESIISPEVARELAQYGPVTRMRANELPAMSAYFAGYKDEGGNWGAWYVTDARVFGWGISEAGHNAIFVNPAGPGGWQNALPATTLSHMGKHAPVLVVNQASVPDPVAAWLDITKPYPTAPKQQLLNHGWIIGGTGTISWETQATLDTMLDGYLTTVEAPNGR